MQDAFIIIQILLLIVHGIAVLKSNFIILVHLNMQTLDLVIRVKNGYNVFELLCLKELLFLLICPQ